MLGCPKCRWLKNGCGACRERPTLARPRQRWQPENGRYQHVRTALCLHGVACAATRVSKNGCCPGGCSFHFT